jgi:tRNA A-37 threonylcarbamoyl transferase component Bud32/tetratricopeptide (TPR) repeat protein
LPQLLLPCATKIDVMPTEPPPHADTQRTPPQTGNGDWLSAAMCRLREEWQIGIRLPIKERLKAWGAFSADPASIAELIYEDFLLRRDRGEASDWDGLLRECAEYAAELRRFRNADEIIDKVIAPSTRRTTLPGFDLLEVVGQGGMGVVYRARDTKLHRIVALKRIRADALAGNAAVERFLKEARAVSRLNHPNIVRIYHAGDCDAEPFIALEFVEGPTLAQRIGGTPLAPRLAATIGAAVALAIQHAHEHRIIHRDLKPANVLLSSTANGTIPKVTDFGAAKDLEHAADGDRTQFLGTPSYLAPEQIDHRWGQVGPLADVYGIGAILYESLTGRAPFCADSISETLRQVVEREPASPRLLNPGVPRSLETICLKCLQKTPAHRYASAAGLADDLDRFLAGQPIHARPVSVAVRSWMWCRRNPMTATLTASLLMALILGIAGITLQWRRAEAASKAAEASDVEAQDLLGELIESSSVAGGLEQRDVSTNIDPLLKAEAHCKNLLQKNPGNIAARIALTRVYGRLSTIYSQMGRPADCEAIVGQAQTLWESLASENAGSRESRYWLANTFGMEDDHDIGRFLRSHQRAGAIWQSLADEQPDNPGFIQKIWECRVTLVNHIAGGIPDNVLQSLQQSHRRLRSLVRQNPGQRTLRKQLALSGFLLGESFSRTKAMEQATAFWHESYEHYHALAKEDSDDLLTMAWLAIASSRLIQGQATDPYYLQAVTLFERANPRLETMRAEYPRCDWLRGLLLENYCCLAYCHAKAGQRAKAEQISLKEICRLAARTDSKQRGPELALNQAMTLVSTGASLLDADQNVVALQMVREAATRCSQLSVNPAQEPNFLNNLGYAATLCSALANRLGEPRLALEQAELARRALEDYLKDWPNAAQHNIAISSSLERIAKAQWSLGNRGEALAAFHRSTTILKSAVDQEPSNDMYRMYLIRSYDRLISYCGKSGALKSAADAVRERAKLWGNNPLRLAKTAEDFESLAKQIKGQSHGQISDKDRAEYDRYCAEAKRARDAARTVSQVSG